MGNFIVSGSGGAALDMLSWGSDVQGTTCAQSASLNPLSESPKGDPGRMAGRPIGSRCGMNWHQFGEWSAFLLPSGMKPSPTPHVAMHRCAQMHTRRSSSGAEPPSEPALQVHTFCSGVKARCSHPQPPKARPTDILKSSAASDERWGITSGVFLHGTQSRGGHAIRPGVENPVALFRTVESHCVPEREQTQCFRALTWPLSAKVRAQRMQVL